MFYPSGWQKCTSDNIRCWQGCQGSVHLICCQWECDLVHPFGKAVLEYLLKLKYAYLLTQLFHVMALSHRKKSIIFKVRGERKSSDYPLIEERLTTLCIRTTEYYAVMREGWP